jgi:beta-glucosidase
MTNDMLRFPDGFLWGAATSAYQIEGGVAEGGRGVSIWDTFCQSEGKVFQGHTGDVACDHYHRYAEDIELMRSLGLHAYRFSIAWPRVLPEGKGKINQQGLDFYERLVDALLAAGIQPFATLYHWDLPQALQDAGGWANRETVGAFCEYADAVSRHLGDRVKNWSTHNEPWVVAFSGHQFGCLAPGIKDLANALQVAHHLLLSHGESVPMLRGNGSAGTQVGISLNLIPVEPASTAEADVAAARRKDGYLNRWFLDPLYKGSYPEDMLDFYGELAPVVQRGDMARIAAPLDFLGVNYYMRNVVQDDPQSPVVQTRQVIPDGAEITEMGWEVYPQGLYDLLTRLHADYHPPAIYITENGAAFPDEATPDGRVFDPRRIAYLDAHLRQAHRAIQACTEHSRRDGVPLKGYFVWSLLDNFEWSHGYSKRFGFVYVFYPTQQRIVKKSGHWYRQVIERNGLVGER